MEKSGVVDAAVCEWLCSHRRESELRGRTTCGDFARLTLLQMLLEYWYILYIGLYIGLYRTYWVYGICARNHFQPAFNQLSTHFCGDPATLLNCFSSPQL